MSTDIPASGHGRPMSPAPILASVITCPHCGFAAAEMMPTDACLVFYECTSCRTLLRPKTGDCCVFCSYGSVRCPPIQMTGGRCREQVASPDQ
jgi:hypothetical protein